MSRLARIVGDEIVFAEYGDRVRFGGRVLFTPTEQTWRDLGFEEVPTASPGCGHHYEYSIAVRKEVRSLIVGAERVEVEHETGEVDGDGSPVMETVMELRPVYGEQEVDVPYIVSTLVEDGPEAQETATLGDYDRALESYLLEVRTARGYNSRDPSEYFNSSVPRWAQDARDWISFRDQVMLFALQKMNEYQETGEPPCTVEEFESGLREISCEWTYLEE